MQFTTCLGEISYEAAVFPRTYAHPSFKNVFVPQFPWSFLVKGCMLLALNPK